MKSLILALSLCFLGVLANAQTSTEEKNSIDNAKKTQIVEASCGQCKFGLKAKGCDLAVRINGKAYFVDGTAIDEHGDAHADDGFCNTIRKAEVKGEVVKNRFVASYFKLLPQEKEKNN